MQVLATTSGMLVNNSAILDRGSGVTITDNNVALVVNITPREILYLPGKQGAPPRPYPYKVISIIKSNINDKEFVAICK
jgi:hypothetical protein